MTAMNPMQATRAKRTKIRMTMPYLIPKVLGTADTIKICIPESAKIMTQYRITYKVSSGFQLSLLKRTTV